MNSSADIKNIDTFFAIAKDRVKFKLFLLRKLPAAFFSGLSVKEINANNCAVVVPFKWFTRNPFRSTYFACLSMAAEMSTGLLVLAYVHGRKPPLSTLIVAIEGKFHKKAVGITTFICNEGEIIKETIEQAYITSLPQTVSILASGYNEKGEFVAAFTITWSFKVKAAYI